MTKKVLGEWFSWRGWSFWNQGVEYKPGKDKLFGFFFGQAMKERKGKGNPQLINKILKEKLNG